MAGKKLVKEATVVLSKIGFQEFILYELEQRPREPLIKPVIETCFQLFSTHPETAIRVLNSVYKEASDDRLCKISAPVLQNLTQLAAQDPNRVRQDSKFTLLAVYAF